ncbi:MAG: DUF3305 domain-containing protein [Gammaproteobacteria bacterium]
MATAPIVDHPDLGPEHFPVSVVLESRPPVHSQWVDEVWSAVGVVVGSRDDGQSGELQLVSDAGGVKRYLSTGLQVALYTDQCESYYHNMMTETPRCYVVAHLDDEETDGRPEPFLVSMSFDEAHAYLEGDDEIYGVDVPPELYRWTEAFVLAHYFPEKKRKRKLKNWKEGEQ